MCVMLVQYSFHSNMSGNVCLPMNSFSTLASQEFFEAGFVKKPTLEKGVHILKAAVRLYRQTTDGLVTDFMKNYASAHGEEKSLFVFCFAYL